MKDTTEAIRNGKTISTMELSHLTASEQQEHETMAICEEQNTEKFPHKEASLCDRELSCSEDELCSEDESQRKFETLNYPEIKRSLTEDAYDIAAKEVAQDVVQKQLSPYENTTPKDTKETVTIEILETRNSVTTDDPCSSFSYQYD